MRKLLLFLGLILATPILIALLSYWGYVAFTDHYIDEGLGKQLAGDRVLPPAPALRRALRADAVRSCVCSVGSSARGYLAVVSWLPRRPNPIVLLLLDKRLEQRYSDEHLIAVYVEVTGIDQAAKKYFGKPVDQVTDAEAAWLFAVSELPHYYLTHPDKAFEARNRLIDTMVRMQWMSPKEAAQAKAEPAPGYKP